MSALRGASPRFKDGALQLVIDQRQRLLLRVTMTMTLTAAEEKEREHQRTMNSEKEKEIRNRKNLIMVKVTAKGKEMMEKEKVENQKKKARRSIKVITMMGAHLLDNLHGHRQLHSKLEQLHRHQLIPFQVDRHLIPSRIRQ